MARARAPCYLSPKIPSGLWGPGGFGWPGIGLWLRREHTFVFSEHSEPSGIRLSPTREHTFVFSEHSQPSRIGLWLWREREFVFSEHSEPSRIGL